MKKSLLTLEPVPQCIPAVTTAIKPEFLRLPPSGQRCLRTGLSRSYLNSLILPTETNGHKPPVESRVLRQRGKVKGVRLIVFDSLITFLNEQTETIDNGRAA
jgi:hypothetical protein